MDGSDEGGVEDTYIGAVQAALTKAMATYMLLVGRIGTKVDQLQCLSGSAFHDVLFVSFELEWLD